MKGTVICELLNMRKTPEKGENVLTVLEQGTELTVLDIAGEWLKVIANDRDGYVMKDFVDLEQTGADENGSFIVDGEVIGYTDGEDIVITDEDIIKENLKDLQQAKPPEMPEQPEPQKKKGGKKDEQAGSVK